jgi:hypothetical protein
VINLINATRTRIGFVTASVVALAAAACGTIADLDVKYDSVGATVDAGNIDPSNTDAAVPKIIRDSSFIEPDAEPPLALDPSDAGPCESDSDDGGGCDFAQGLGCCLLGGGSSACIYSWEIETKCKSGLFVGCRADDPTSESACCWREGPAGSRLSAYATSCDGGAHACIPLEAGSTETDGTPCNASACPVKGGTFVIGTTGTTLGCPQ